MRLPLILTSMRFKVFSLAALVALAGSASAQTTPLTTKLPIDPKVRIGTLSNGLRYYIRQNTRPEKRAELRLVVNAGSVLETPDKLGLAHFVEHTAFNGTKHFAKNDLIKYLESIGVRFGADLNAYTSFDETVYMLEVPTDRDGLLTRGFEALSDFAGGASLEDSEIDRERGVVIEEWRGRQGAGTRMQGVQMEGLFGESRYVDRLPIGLPELLKSVPAQRVRDFYRRFVMGAQDAEQQGALGRETSKLLRDLDDRLDVSLRALIDSEETAGDSQRANAQRLSRPSAS